MKTSEFGKEFLMQVEGVELEAYEDVVGVLTIGVGSTGPHVKPGMKITRAEAMKLLEKDLVRFEEAVNKYVKVPLKQLQFDMLVSFAFNVGVGAFRGSGLLKKVNAKASPEDLWISFKGWAKAGGKVVPGLLTRRTKEFQNFIK